MSHPDPQWTDGGREQVFAEALHQPETPEEASAQQAKFRTWREDPRYQHLWTMLDRLIPPRPCFRSGGRPSGPRERRPMILTDASVVLIGLG